MVKFLILNCSAIDWRIHNELCFACTFVKRKFCIPYRDVQCSRCAERPTTYSKKCKREPIETAQPMYVQGKIMQIIWNANKKRSQGIRLQWSWGVLFRIYFTYWIRRRCSIWNHLQRHKKRSVSLTIVSNKVGFVHLRHANITKRKFWWHHNIFSKYLPSFQTSLNRFYVTQSHRTAPRTEIYNEVKRIANQLKIKLWLFYWK